MKFSNNSTPYYFVVIRPIFIQKNVCTGILRKKNILFVKP